MYEKVFCSRKHFLILNALRILDQDQHCTSNCIRHFLKALGNGITYKIMIAKNDPLHKKIKPFPSRCCFKDIVQPKKRGVKRVTIPTVMTSHTLADVF